MKVRRRNWFATHQWEMVEQCINCIELSKRDGRAICCDACEVVECLE